MTKVKFCGIRRETDIAYANRIHPDLVGFVFAKKSRRYISPEDAFLLRQKLLPDITTVGVFVNEPPENIAAYITRGIITVPQLHGQEDESYIKKLRQLTNAPVIQAFCIRCAKDLEKAERSSAEYILLDAGAGDGKTFDWSLLSAIDRPYFLAGGLDSSNVGDAISLLHPYGVDVSSGIETDGFKDQDKMTDFMHAVRKGDNL